MIQNHIYYAHYYRRLLDFGGLEGRNSSLGALKSKRSYATTNGSVQSYYVNEIVYISMSKYITNNNEIFPRGRPIGLPKSDYNVSLFCNPIQRKMKCPVI